MMMIIIIIIRISLYMIDSLYNIQNKGERILEDNDNNKNNRYNKMIETNKKL